MADIRTLNKVPSISTLFVTHDYRQKGATRNVNKILREALEPGPQSHSE